LFPAVQTRTELLLAIEIEGQLHHVLVDSGASLSILKEGISNTEIFPTEQAAKGVTGNLLEILGIQNAEFKLGKTKFCFEFVTAPLDVEYSGVLGVDILKYMEARVDLRTNELVVGKTRYPLRGLEANIGEESSRQPHLRCVNLQTGPAIPEAVNHEEDTGSSPSVGRSREHPDRVRSVTTLESTILPPMSQVLVVAKLRNTRELNLPSEVLTEPCEIGISGIYVARSLSKVFTKEEFIAQRETEIMGTSPSNVLINNQNNENIKNNSNSGYCYMKLLNTSTEHVSIRKNKLIGFVEDLYKGTENYDDTGNHKVLDSCGTIYTVHKESLRTVEEIRETCKQKLSHLDKEEYEIIAPVLEEYIDLFSDVDTGRLPCTTKGCHEIRTGDALPIKKNPYRVPYALKDEMKRQLDTMLEKGVTTPCASSWAAPVILLPKKSPDGTPKYRFCTDFRALNAVTQTPVYPIPDIKNNLSLMAGSRYFTLIDIENAYWNIPIKLAS
jgi:hypothetical protein